MRVLGQFWRLLKLCIAGEGGKFGLVLYAIVLALELSQILVSLRMIEWSKTFYDALQQVDGATALTQVGIFFVIVTTGVLLTLSSSFTRQHLEIRWRRSLTNAAMTRWLGNRSYLKLERERTNTLDNPDQRIAEDCRFFLAGPMGEHGGGIGLIPLSLDLITNIVAIFSYVAVLWSIASFALPLGFAGINAEIPRYMVWAAFIYVALSTGLTHFLGKPLKRLYAEQQRREADFRFGLIRVRENAEPIAMASGETAERRDLDRRFGGIVINWKKLINRELILMSFTYPYRSTVLRIPTFLALPAFFAGSVTFGGLMQLASAFSSVTTTLSWFIFSYRPLADLVAAAGRLESFLNATDGSAGARPGIVERPSPNGTLALANLELFAPDGRRLLGVDGLTVGAGEAIWLVGPSGLGKTTLLKTLAGTWSNATGRIETPAGAAGFLPQDAYLPTGSVLDAVAYPRDPSDIPVAEREAALLAVGLGHLILSYATEAAKGLSGGEQQRLALARLLLLKPEWAFLDEATSALDIAAERQLLGLLRRELPGTAFVVVAHREPTGLGPIRKVELATAPIAAPYHPIPA
jgi:putative ATP-binding cassette transporter